MSHRKLNSNPRSLKIRSVRKWKSQDSALVSFNKERKKKLSEKDDDVFLPSTLIFFFFQTKKMLLFSVSLCNLMTLWVWVDIFNFSLFLTLLSFPSLVFFPFFPLIKLLQSAYSDSGQPLLQTRPVARGSCRMIAWQLRQVLTSGDLPQGNIKTLFAFMIGLSPVMRLCFFFLCWKQKTKIKQNKLKQ